MAGDVVWRATRPWRGAGGWNADSEPVGDRWTTEVYVTLHTAYEQRWRAARAVTALSYNSFTTVTSVATPLVLTTCAVANVAVGSCIPLWIIVWLLVTLSRLYIDLAQLPAANDQIDSILSLYLDARTALQAMLTQAARVQGQPAAAELREHVVLLTSFCAADNLRATFVGIVVTWGLAKTLLATTVTLSVALWSVLRGAGMSFTIESVCPSY
ncbi:hypothetical protein DFJ74DRAFT_239044 [Hyaloraphidium curvatum]|nr:hypothetical protein DFJ74DRAFT_239044 [Hyaloraphidium curvatum]